MGAEDNARFAREVYDLFNQGRLAEAADKSADDVEVVLIPFDMTFNGRDGFLGFMKGFKDAFPDLRIAVDTQVATDSHVVNECTWNGTHTGPLQSPQGEIPPTGKAVSGARFCEVWTIRGGELARIVNYQDVSTWLRQLGLVS